MWNNANPTLRVMWPLHQGSMYRCGEGISNRQSIEKLQWRGFSCHNERQVSTGTKSLQPIVAINTELLWVLQAFTSRHGQTGYPGQLFHILYQSKQLDIPPRWCPLRERHGVTPKREITWVSKHAYHPFSEELASEILQCLRQHKLAGLAGMSLLSHQLLLSSGVFTQEKKSLQLESRLGGLVWGFLSKKYSTKETAKSYRVPRYSLTDQQYFVFWCWFSVTDISKGHIIVLSPVNPSTCSPALVLCIVTCMHAAGWRLLGVFCKLPEGSLAPRAPDSSCRQLRSSLHSKFAPFPKHIRLYSITPLRDRNPSKRLDEVKSRIIYLPKFMRHPTYICFPRLTGWPLHMLSQGDLWRTVRAAQ